MKRTHKRLILRTETIRALTGLEIHGVRGGYIYGTITDEMGNCCTGAPGPGEPGTVTSTNPFDCMPPP